MSVPQPWIVFFTRSDSLGEAVALRPHALRPHGGVIVATACAALLLCAGAAQAGPCSANIAQLQRQIGQSLPGPESGPDAPQSVGAQLHHQPTPATVQNAESKAKSDAAAALQRAQQADAEGNAAACSKALDEARLLYGVN